MNDKSFLRENPTALCQKHTRNDPGTLPGQDPRNVPRQACLKSVTGQYHINIQEQVQLCFPWSTNTSQESATEDKSGTEVKNWLLVLTQGQFHNVSNQVVMHN